MAENRAAARTPAVVQRKPVVAARARAQLPIARPAPAARNLQQRIGNSGTQALAVRAAATSATAAVPRIQTSLTVSQPGDKYEQEADRVADKVMRMPASQSLSMPEISSVSATTAPVRRACAECKGEMEEKRVQRRETGSATPEITPAVEANVRTLQGEGSPLPKATRDFFEPRMGADFSQVRVNNGARANETANALGARAFTVGRSISFAPGHYAPASHEGQKLLAHELTHVVQQGDGVARVQRWEEPEHKAIGNKAQGDFPFRGTVPTDMTALRSTPNKDPKSPHTNTKADIRSGAGVLVVGRERGWLKVVLESGNARDRRGATVPAQSLTGFISPELVKKSSGSFDAELPLEGGLTLSYGDLVAFGGDHFKDFSEIVDESKTPSGVERLKKLRDVIDATGAKSPNYEDANTITKEYADKYVALALENIAHFSHGGTAVDTWMKLHVDAVAQAYQAGLAGDSAALGKAYALNAFADHFLSDAFSSGHVRVPREKIMAFYKQLAIDVFANIVTNLSERLGNRIFQLLQHDYARVRAFADDNNRRDAVARVRTQVNAAIARAGGTAKVQELFGLYVGGAVSKILHDDENAAGLKVVSAKHPEGWMAYGDSKLATPENATNLAFATEAVKQSKSDILKAFNIGVDIRTKNGKSPPKKAMDAGLEAVAKKVGPPFAPAEFVPRPAPGVSPLPAWEWGSLDAAMQGKIAALIGRYLTTTAQGQVLAQLPVAETVEVDGPDVVARPRDAGRDVLNDLLADPVRFLGEAFGRRAGL